jgi:pimeloyl-ACP methyl ester carboxylesterase
MRVTPFVDRGIAGRAGDTNTDVLTSIRAPVTLVFGGKDPIINPTTARAVSSTFAGAAVVDFADAGHAPFIEDARRFDDLLDRSQCHASATVRTITHDQIEAAYATPESRFKMVDGVRIHYKDQGSGPAILLIHGSFGDTIDWDGWVGILSPRYRVIRIDLPGFGLSGEISDGNYSIDRSLSLIDGLMDDLGIDRFAIAGVSYGGPIAFRYAATRTERVTALVIVNSAGIEQGKQAVDPKTHTQAFYKTLMSDDAVTREYVQGALARGFNDPALIPPSMVQRKLDMMNVIGRNIEGAAMVKQYVRGNPEQVLSHVRAPTLVLWGAAERSLSVSTADQFVAALTHARSVRKVMVPGGDHMMHVELSIPTGTAAKDFLDATVPR